MTIAQTKAARKKFLTTSPQFKAGVSQEVSARREAAYRERQRKIAGRKGKKGK